MSETHWQANDQAAFEAAHKQPFPPTHPDTPFKFSPSDRSDLSGQIEEEPQIC